MTAHAVPAIPRPPRRATTGVSAVKINGTVVYAATEPDPLDASLVQARQEYQKSPEYAFHLSVSFLNRTVNGQPLGMMRELEQALELNDPISADQIRQAAAAAAKKPPSYEQLLELRKHFAKETQEVMVADAKEADRTFTAVEKPLLPALEHPSFDAFTLTATLKQLGKGAKYSAGQPAMKNMDSFLKQYFRYAEVVRQIATVKVSEIQKGLDSTRAVLASLAESLSPEQQQLVDRITGEIAHQQSEVNVVASLSDANRLIVPQLALQGVSLTGGSLDSSTIMQGVTGQMATLINAGDAQRARTATELSQDMSEAPPKKKTFSKGDPTKAKPKVSDSSGDNTDSGAATGYDAASKKSPGKKMPPPSPRTPKSGKRKQADGKSGEPKKPKADTPTNGKQPQKQPPAAGTPKVNQPKDKGAAKHPGGKDGHKGGKGGKGDHNGAGTKSQQTQ